MRGVGRPPCVVTHGGAANVAAVRDGCARACAAGLASLVQGDARAGGSALAAAIASVVVLEDDPRMNAGTGSALRDDGSCQLDAAVMDARGFGAVAVVEDVKNPVLLARLVYDTPHLLVAGAGATELARRHGLAPAVALSAEQRARLAARLALRKPAHAVDTVGVVVRDADGAFAAAGSTGGLWACMRGRVGDVPIPGAGLYVGAAGAVAATGTGEVIWRELLARRCHDAMARGLSAQGAVDDCVAFVRARWPDVDVGLIAVDVVGSGGGATGEMPWCALVPPAGEASP